MTAAELSEHEWIEERIGILMYMAGMSEADATIAARRQWELWSER